MIDAYAGHSGLMPATLTTLAHLSVSLAMSFADTNNKIARSVLMPT
jgi:hypothetical protein